MKLLPSSLALVVGILPIAFSRPLFAHTLFAHTHSQIESYPANSRATFLAGCILDEDNAPDFSNRQEVYNRVEACVCLLDRFQQRYSHDRFVTLFAGLERGDSQARREMGDFFRNNVPGCLAQLEG